MKNEEFVKIVSCCKKAIPLNNGDGTRLLINHNKLLRLYDGAVGIKTGYTKRCGRCLVSCAQRDGVTLVCVTLNAPNDWNDHKSMLDYGFSQYESVHLASTGDYCIDFSILNGNKPSCIASNQEDLCVTLPKSHGEISATLEYDRLLSAPVKKGDVLGKIVYKIDNEEIGRIDLISCETVHSIIYKKSFFERLFKQWKK